MKFFYTYKSCSGFSTLEMLIAMAILVLALSSVVITGASSQSIIVDSQIASEALGRAQRSIEYAQALARKDFKLVNPTSTTFMIGPTAYIASTTVEMVGTDHAQKKITSTVLWKGEYGRSQHVSLSALVTNFPHAVGGDTCDSVLPDRGWDAPFTENAIVDFRQLIATSTGINVITNLDAHKGKLYVTVGNTTYKSDPTLFIFDIAKLKSVPTHALLGKLDTAPTTATGLLSLHIAEGTTTGSMYAYVANENPSNWGTCTLSYNCAQLQIIDVSSSTNITLASTTNYKIPATAVTNPVTGSGGQGVGDSIFYKDGLVYLGLTKTGSGPEFNIIDVHNPLLPQRVGSYVVGASVSAITVVGNLAYLATNDNARELIVLNVTNPVSPTLASSYDAVGSAGFGYGLSLYTVGDALYLGRTYVSNGPEFLILDSSSSASMMPTTPLSLSDIGVPGNTFSTNAIMVRDYLSFVVGGSPSSGGKLYIKKVSDPANITDWATAVILPGGSLGSGLDCEGNDLFVSSNDVSNNGYLSVITSTP